MGNVQVDPFSLKHTPVLNPSLVPDQVFGPSATPVMRNVNLQPDYRTPLPATPLFLLTGRGRHLQQRPQALPRPDSFDDRISFTCPAGCKLRMRATSRERCFAQVEIRLGSGVPEPWTLAVDFSTPWACLGCRGKFRAVVVEAPAGEGSSSEASEHEVFVLEDRVNDEKARLMCSKRALQRELDELLKEEDWWEREHPLEDEVSEGPARPPLAALGHLMTPKQPRTPPPVHLRQYLSGGRPKQPTTLPPAHLLHSTPRSFARSRSPRNCRWEDLG